MLSAALFVRILYGEAIACALSFGLTSEITLELFLCALPMSLRASLRCASVDYTLPIQVIIRHPAAHCIFNVVCFCRHGGAHRPWPN